MHLKILPAKWQPFCPGGDELTSIERYGVPVVLPIVAWWCDMITYIWINIGSGNGLLPDGLSLTSQFYLISSLEMFYKHTNVLIEFTGKSKNWYEMVNWFPQKYQAFQFDKQLYYNFQWQGYLTNWTMLVVLQGVFFFHLKHYLNSSPPSACHIYVLVNWVTIGSGKSRQTITRTNADILSIGPLRTNFNENWIEILTFSFKKMQLKLSSAKMAAILSRRKWVKPSNYAPGKNYYHDYILVI